MTPEQSTTGPANGREETEDDAGSGVRTEWDRVSEQHAKIVQALNDTPVSVTIRSAEGLRMFQGLADASSNGDVHELLREGHEASVAQALGETPGLGDPPAGKDQPATSI